MCKYTIWKYRGCPHPGPEGGKTCPKAKEAKKACRKMEAASKHLEGMCSSCEKEEEKREAKRRHHESKNRSKDKYKSEHSTSSSRDTSRKRDDKDKRRTERATRDGLGQSGLGAGPNMNGPIGVMPYPQAGFVPAPQHPYGGGPAYGGGGQQPCGTGQLPYGMPQQVPGGGYGGYNPAYPGVNEGYGGYKPAYPSSSVGYRDDNNPEPALQYLSLKDRAPSRTKRPHGTGKTHFDSVDARASSNCHTRHQTARRDDDFEEELPPRLLAPSNPSNARRGKKSEAELISRPPRNPHTGRESSPPPRGARTTRRSTGPNPSAKADSGTELSDVSDDEDSQYSDTLVDEAVADLNGSEKGFSRPPSQGSFRS